MWYVAAGSVDFSQRCFEGLPYTDEVRRIVELLGGLGVSDAISHLHHQMPIGFFGHHLLRFDAVIPELPELTNRS